MQKKREAWLSLLDMSHVSSDERGKIEESINDFCSRMMRANETHMLVIVDDDVARLRDELRYIANPRPFARNEHTEIHTLVEQIVSDLELLRPSNIK